MRGGAVRRLLLPLVPLLAAATADPGDMLEFDWTSIEPSTTLNYTSCYENYKCARLLVPLDWLNPEDTADQVAIAILTLPADVNHDDPSYGGTIIVNPGGPNGSGANFVYRSGKLMQGTANAGSKKYDILGFDPRGVGFSTPNANCHRDVLARSASVIEQRAIGALDASTDNLRQNMALARGRGLLCEADEENNKIRAYMSTTSVVRDMVRMVDVLEDLDQGTTTSQDEEEYPTLELRASRDTTPRINYWGFSYGTVIGRYFAAMYPGRIRRMILEGVEDVHDYYNGSWATNLVDAAKGQEYLWQTCYEGGENCDLYKPTDNGPEDIRDRVLAFIQDIHESPAVITAPHGYTFLDHTDVLGNIFMPLYHPQTGFSRLATALADAMEGNYTRLFTNLNYPNLSQSCSAAPPTYPYKYTWSTDALAAIACGDAPSQLGLSVDEFESYLDRLHEDSPEYTSIWASIRLTCTGWRIRPEDRFTGPWTSPAHDPSLVEGLPAAPILFASALIDPVTPLINARIATADHPGSAILVQDNAGHGSLGSPGQCRDGWISHYLDTGEVPPEKETFCKADCVPFKECPQLDEMISTLSRQELLEQPWMPLGMNL